MSKRRPETADVQASPAKPERPSAAGGNFAVLAVFFVFAVGLVAYLKEFMRVVAPSHSTSRMEEFLDAAATFDWWIQGMFGDVPEAVGILDRIPVLLGAAAILAAGYAAGRFAVETLQLDRGLKPIERIVFAFGVGLNLLSLTTLAAGLAGLLTIWLFLPALLALSGAAIWKWWRQTVEVAANGIEPVAEDAAPDPAGEEEPVAIGIYIALLVLAVPTVLMLILGGVMPPWEFDVREYHLQVPKEWSQQGYIGFMPHNAYGNMPLGTEMHSLLAMVLSPGDRPWYWGALVGKTITALFPILTAASLFALGERLRSPFAGALAAALYLGIPWVSHVSMAGLIDAVLANYAILTLHAIVVALQTEEVRDDAPLWQSPWLLAGFLAGAAAACKYTGVPLVAVPVVVVAIVGLGRFDWKAPLLVLLAAAAGGGLWYAKNAVLAGNPVYPLLGQVFGGESRTPEMIRQWNRVHSPQPDAFDETHSLAQLGESLQNALVNSEWLSPVLMPLAALAFLAIVSGRHRAWVLLIGGWCLWMFVVWWGASHRLDRFLLPIYPLLALLAGLGAAWSSLRWWRLYIVGVVGLGMVYTWSCFTSGYFSEYRFFVGLDYLRTDVPPAGIDRWSRIFANYRRLVTEGPPKATDEVTMIIAKADVFDIDGPLLYATCFDEPPLETLLSATLHELHAAPPEGTAARADRERVGRLCQTLFDKFREARVNKVYMDWWSFLRYRGLKNYGFSPFIRDELFDELTDLEILIEHDSGEPNLRRKRGFSIFLVNADFRVTPEIIDRAIQWRAKAAKQEPLSRIPGERP